MTIQSSIGWLHNRFLIVHWSNLQESVERTLLFNNHSDHRTKKNLFSSSNWNTLFKTNDFSNDEPTFDGLLSISLMSESLSMSSYRQQTTVTVNYEPFRCNAIGINILIFFSLLDRNSLMSVCAYSCLLVGWEKINVDSCVLVDFYLFSYFLLYIVVCVVENIVGLFFFLWTISCLLLIISTGVPIFSKTKRSIDRWMCIDMRPSVTFLRLKISAIVFI